MGLHICESKMRDEIINKDLAGCEFYAIKFEGDIRPLSELYFEVVGWYDDRGIERCTLVVDTHPLNWLSRHLKSLEVEFEDGVITDGVNRAYKVVTHLAYRLHSPLVVNDSLASELDALRRQILGSPRWEVTQFGNRVLDVWPYWITLLPQLSIDKKDYTPYLILDAKCFGCPSWSYNTEL